MWKALLLISFHAAVVSRAETVSSAEKKIDALWRNTTSYTASLELNTQLKRMVTTIRTAGKGTLACMKSGDTLLYRLELATGSSVGDQDVDQRTTHVFDGEYLYTQIDSWGASQVTRTKVMLPSFVSGMVPGSGKSVFKELHQNYRLKLLPDETVGEQTCYVFDLTLRAKDPSKAFAADGRLLPSRIKLYFAKDTGLLTRLMVLLEPDDVVYMTITYKDIQVNPTLAPDTFQYTAPKSITVIDLPHPAPPSDAENMPTTSLIPPLPAR